MLTANVRFLQRLVQYKSGELTLNVALHAPLLFVCVIHRTHRETCLLEALLCATVHNLKGLSIIIASHGTSHRGRIVKL